MIGYRTKADAPNIVKGEVKSKMYLCVVSTPSMIRWSLGYYDTRYAKEFPWRNEYNNPINVTHYQELPELPDG